MGQTQFGIVPPDAVGPQHREQTVSFTFSGGRNRALPPHMLPASDCWELENFCYPREAAVPQVRPGAVLFKGLQGPDPEVPALPGPVKAVTVYQKSVSESYTICACLVTGTHLELWAIDPADNSARKIWDLGAGNLVVPTFATYGGKLYVAQQGEYIKEWRGQFGYASAKSAGALAVLDIDKILLFDNEPDPAVIASTLTVGESTFTFVAERAHRWQITKGYDLASSAANIATAINEDCTDVKAVAVDDDVTITARVSGLDGDDLALSTTVASGGFTLTAFTGGADGVALDEIDTYQAPKGGILIADKNQRLVCAGDTTADKEDTVFFSGATNAWEWAVGDYYSGVNVGIGYLNGNRFTALRPFIDAIMVHKGGQNPDVYRLFVGDADPANWHVTMFSGHSAALGHECAVSVAGRHLVLDAQTFRIYAGTDTYEQISADPAADGLKVQDMFERMTSEAFIVPDMSQMYALVFPAVGSTCAVFHFGSKRWAKWSFSAGAFSCGVYSESLGKIILGAEDGLYVLEPLTFADAGVNFSARILGPAFGGGDTEEKICLQAILDYKSLAAASGQVALAIDRSEDKYLKLGDFDTPSVGTFFTPEAWFSSGLNPLGDDLSQDVSPYLYSQAFGRKVTFTQAVGAMLAPRVEIESGGLAVNSFTMRVASKGRTGK